VALTNNNPAFEDLSMGNADYSSEVQACVSWYAITDLTTATNQQWTPNLMGFGAATNYEACWNASPLANVPDEVCPIYLQHGLADTAVDYEDSLYLYNEIVKKTGDTSRVKLELFPGINHATAKFLSEENVDRIVAWLDVQMPEVTQEDLDKEAAAKVDALIDAVDLADKATIDAARAAYDALTDDQKAWVTSLADLEAAERHWNTVHSVVELVLTGADKVDAADETVTYTLSGKDMHDLATVVLSFDITEDYLTDPVAEAAEGWVLMAQTWRDGKLNVALINPAGANGEGEIVTVTADIREKAGNAAVTLTYTELAAYLGTGETFVQADLTKASVSTEVRYNIFDVNKDGVVDLRDATRAQRYFGIYHADADVNRDGNVNVEDIILILNNYTDMFQ